MLADEQTHQLPADALTRERVALAMGARDFAALLQELDAHRARVSGHFRAVVFGARMPTSRTVRIDLGRFWDTQAETAALADSLARAGFPTASEVARLLLELRGSSLVRRLDEPGRRRLQALLPALLADVAASSSAAAGAAARARDHRGDRRSVPPISRCCARTSPRARAAGRAVPRTAISSAQQIAAHPLLLDELIDERLLRSRRSGRRSRAISSRASRSVDPRTTRSSQVEALRQFQRAAVFRVAVADLTGSAAGHAGAAIGSPTSPSSSSSARMDLAWQQMTAQFGVPTAAARARQRRAVRICAVGYGKLGGMELGYCLGSGSGVPARFAAASSRRPTAARSRSTTRCSSCASRSASCTC